MSDFVRPGETFAQLAARQATLIDQLAKQNERLRTALEKVEWVRDLKAGEHCPCCFGPREYGHTADCVVRQALGRLSQGKLAAIAEKEGAK